VADQSRHLAPRRFGGAAIAALVFGAGLLCAPTDAGAHQISANYETVVRSITPATPGLSATINKKKGRIVLTNRSGKNVVVFGYDHDRYARLDADGRVYVNRRSPATYLNEDIYGNATVPDFASARARPQWSLVATDFTFDWHDHRIHWMSPEPPVAVVNLKQRKKIFDWRVPLEIGSKSGSIDGTLYWAGSPKAPPLASIAVFGISAIVIVIGGLIWFRKTRELDDEQVENDASPRKGSW
jgi:hypothetical protein